MKLLIVTQVVDADDPVLGFFHRWISEFAQRYEHIEVICLRQGRYSLPDNVRVHSLGKEKGAPRFARRAVYSWRFLTLAWRLRREYDAVFVHMNEEYVLIAGGLWRLWGKRIVFWRNFRTGTWMTPIACHIANRVCYTSCDSFTARFANSTQMPIGIDTGFFTPGTVPATPRSILFLGRVDPVKKVTEFIQALKLLHEKGISFSATIVGDPSDLQAPYNDKIRALAAPLVEAGILAMRPGVTNEEAREVFRAHDIYCNLSPPGLFDKTIGESIGCGAIVVTVNKDTAEAAPTAFIAETESPEIVAECLRSALELGESDRQALSAKLREWIERKHSLSLLSEKLASLYV